jgi:hypothetical protein
MKTLILIPVLLLSTPSIAQRGYVERAVQDKYEDKYGDHGKDKLNEWVNGKVLNVKTEPEYVFTMSVTMEMTDYKNGKKKEPTQIKYFLHPGKNYFGTSVPDKKKADEEMFMIYELVNNYMLMLDVKKKTGTAISMNAFMSGKAIEERNKKMAGENTGSTVKNDCKKTGKNKTILGYPCEEFICIDEEKGTRSEFWFTTKIPVDISRAYMRSPYSIYFGNSGQMGGMLMEGDFYKNDELQSTMLVTEVNTNADRKEVMKDYKINGF